MALRSLSLEKNGPNWAVVGLLAGLAAAGVHFGPQLPEMLGLEVNEAKKYMSPDEFYPFYL